MKKSKKTKTIPPALKGRIQTNRSRPRTSSRKKSKPPVPPAVFLALGGIIFLILAIKLIPAASQGSRTAQVKTPVKNTKTEETAKADSSVKENKFFANAAKTSVMEKVKAVPVVKEEKKIEAAEADEKEIALQKVAFAKPLQQVQDTPMPKKSLPKKPAAVPTSQDNKAAPVERVVAAKKSSMILDPEEQAELDRLKKVHQLDMTNEIRSRINHLNNKYLWFKSMRYQYPRVELERRWAERSGEIDHKNKILQSRRSTMFPRPLQILLEGVTDPKRRGYLMRVWQKPVSFAEKEMCRRASEQAKRERMNRIYNYDKEREKVVNRKILKDKYGYEYYLNEKGERVYID